MQDVDFFTGIDLLDANWKPQAVHQGMPQICLLLTALSPISHHDPDIRDKSNQLMFNRQKQMLSGEAVAASNIDIDEIDYVCRNLSKNYLVPGDIIDLLDTLNLPEFIACAIAREFMDRYNSAEGTGLFEGMERYSRLESRLRQAAVATFSLRAMWDRLCDTMRVPIHGEAHDNRLYNLLWCPLVLQTAVLRAIQRDYRSVVALARLWHTQIKTTIPEYAKAAKIDVAPPPVEPPLSHRTDWVNSAVSEIVIEVPTITGNSLRHEVVRAPAAWHLLRRLGLSPAVPGKGPLPAGVEAMLFNGGNKTGNSHEATSAFALAWKVRELYPTLDLLGGVCDAFDLGESRLKVNGWLVCRENVEALAGTPAEGLPAAHISIFDMLDDYASTRQAVRDQGQMIMSQEVLCPGVQIYVTLGLSPFAPRLTVGALAAAVRTYIGEDSTIAGGSARGFGLCRASLLESYAGDELVAEYEAYIDAHADDLRAGLCEGTLGTGKVILS